MKAVSFLLPLLLLLLHSASIFIFSQAQSIVSQPQVLKSKDFTNIQVWTVFFLEKMIQTDPSIRLDFFSLICLLFGCSECWELFFHSGHKDKLLVGLIHKRSNQSGLWWCLWQSGSFFNIYIHFLFVFFWDKSIYFWILRWTHKDLGQTHWRKIKFWTLLSIFLNFF